MSIRFAAVERLIGSTNRYVLYTLKPADFVPDVKVIDARTYTEAVNIARIETAPSRVVTVTVLQKIMDGRRSRRE